MTGIAADFGVRVACYAGSFYVWGPCQPPSVKVFDTTFLKVLILVRDLLVRSKDRSHLLSVPACAEHHIPHTGNDHDKTHPIYKIGVSRRWPWSLASALTGKTSHLLPSIRAAAFVAYAAVFSTAAAGTSPNSTYRPATAPVATSAFGPSTNGSTSKTSTQPQCCR